MVLVTTQAGRQMVVQCCALTQAAGVCPSMPLADAQAVLGCTDMWVQPFEPERDQQALEALARWATRFSPVVAVDASDGLLMDPDDHTLVVSVRSRPHDGSCVRTVRHRVVLVLGGGLNFCDVKLR